MQGRRNHHGELILEAGTILQNNHLDGLSDGAVVAANGYWFEMEGESIHGNYAEDAYAASVIRGTTMYMRGGSICGNGTSNGSAIIVGTIPANSSGLEIYDGSISNNVSTNVNGSNHSAIKAWNGIVIMLGGEISGNSSSFFLTNLWK